MLIPLLLPTQVLNNEIHNDSTVKKVVLNNK